MGLYTTCGTWLICGALYSSLHYLYPRDMERIFEERRQKQDGAGAGLSAELTTVCAAEMWHMPFDTIFPTNMLVPQRCGACHSACMDSAGQCCRDAAHSATFECTGQTLAIQPD